MTRQANKREIAWCERLRKLMEKKPPKMELYSDGNLKAVDAKELLNYDEIEEFQPLQGIGFIGECAAGDPWK